MNKALVDVRIDEGCKRARGR